MKPAKKAKQLNPKQVNPRQIKAPLKTSKRSGSLVLSDEVTALMASHIIATAPAPEVAERIKTRLLQRTQSQQHVFVFAEQGEWNAVAAGVKIKLLHQNTNGRSFLIQMEADSGLEGHVHEQDEESFVLDGEVWLEGVLCKPGDYHYALAGSRHQRLHTALGCTLLVKNS